MLAPPLFFVGAGLYPRLLLPVRGKAFCLSTTVDRHVTARAAKQPAAIYQSKFERSRLPRHAFGVARNDNFWAELGRG